MTTSPTTTAAVDLGALGARLPDGVRVRAADLSGTDLDRMIAFQNKYARPAQQMALDVARRFEDNNPQPKRLVLFVEDAAGEMQAVAQTGDGGVFSRGDGVFRMGLRVAPEWRRRGIGTALLETLEQHSRAQGAVRQITSIRGDEPEGLEFARARGYEEYHQRVDSYVDVQSFDPSGFDDPDEVARKAGVRLVPYADLAREHGATSARLRRTPSSDAAPPCGLATPPESLEAFQRALYAVISEASQDIPSAEPIHNPPFEAIREMYFGEKSFDHACSIIAVRDGKPVGSTMTIINDAGVAYTVHTGMLRSERGKGIATALKLRAIRALKERGAKQFGTTNDEANAAMRGINRRLGYQPDPPTVQVRKSLV
jgi:GNAT superfamily N-acetyltransferase